jgi:hypothetical protein
MDEPNIDWTAIVAEHKIREAEEAGEFKNLRGAGEPLSDELLSTPVFERFTGRLMQMSGALPEWLQLQKDIEQELRELKPFRDRTIASMQRTRNRATRERMAHRLRSVYRERIDLLNVLVLKYNVNAPASAARHYRAYKVREEMAQLETAIEDALRAAVAVAGLGR